MIDERWTYQPDAASPPGETLLDLLEERELTQKELALRMGRPLKTTNGFAQKVLAYTDGLDQAGFVVSGLSSTMGPCATWNSSAGPCAPLPMTSRTSAAGTTFPSRISSGAFPAA